MAHDAFDSEAFLATLTKKPGVYRMLGAGADVYAANKARGSGARS